LLITIKEQSQPRRISTNSNLKMMSGQVLNNNGKVSHSQSAEADPSPRQRFQTPIEEAAETTSAVILRNKEMSKRFQLIVKKLSLKRDERSLAAEIINDLTDQLIDFLRKNEKYACFKEVKKLTTGSYYEYVKVARRKTWRISFSHIEKTLLMNHGAMKNCCEKGAVHCCRKSCLKLMKHLVHILKEQYPKELSKLHSYCKKLHISIQWSGDPEMTNGLPPRWLNAFSIS
ncbi:hypothetical protein scyTo_0007690, partial [Scyliorhinus torazame]|nr:hypothetical protein [Scyliorhinus torazame]